MRIFAVLGFGLMICVAASSSVDAAGCPAGTVPVPETDNCVPAKRPRSVEKSTLCLFKSGPRRGNIVDYSSYGLAPLPLGVPCNDGVASQGIVVRGGE